MSPERLPRLTAVIVDDEERPRQALTKLLARTQPRVQLLGAASNVPEGIDVVRQCGPDVIFLDIDLGPQTGFELLKSLGERPPYVIFTTGHESYALTAIRFSALAYLLKPVDKDELDAAVRKAQAAVLGSDRTGMVEMLLRNMDRANGERPLALPVSDGYQMVHINEVLLCASSGNYTTLHLRNNKTMVISRPIGHFEELLQKHFIRIHNEYLVNANHIVRYIRGEGGEVILSNGMNIAVSRRKKSELMGALNLV
jgi:two-component system LytT family response regulator